MQSKHWVPFLLLSVSFSQLALSQSYKDFPVNGNDCQRQIHNKGIPIGNNNYQGRDCFNKKPNETQDVILIQERSKSSVTNDGTNRQIASGKEELIEYEAQEKNMLKEVDYIDKPHGHDYADEE